ncbi:hypothetical protein CP01DC11_1230B, partial [Chlamydia psittaci 01DC11]
NLIFNMVNIVKTTFW